MAFFFMAEWPILGRFFYQIWTSEGPNVVKIINARVSNPFPVTFPGGKFWYHEKKKGPLAGPSRGQIFHMPIFTKIVFGQACFLAV